MIGCFLVLERGRGRAREGRYVGIGVGRVRWVFPSYIESPLPREGWGFVIRVYEAQKGGRIGVICHR